MERKYELVEYEENLLISSNPAAGSSNLSPDGSRFELNFRPALQIPQNATDITVSAEESEVWWTVPNITTNSNDKMYITAPNVADVLTPFIITIPQGLYDLTGLTQAVQRELENAGAKISPNPVVSFSPDDATQKVEMRFNYVGTQVDFTPIDTFRIILGFNSAVVGPNVSAPLNYIAPNVAEFNQINYFLIHSNLVKYGIRYGNQFNQTLARVLINTAPGSQIISTPFNPPRINANELAGVKKDDLQFWLTDDQNRPVNTNGEYWSTRIVIRFKVPHAY